MVNIPRSAYLVIYTRQLIPGILFDTEPNIKIGRDS